MSKPCPVCAVRTEEVTFLREQLRAVQQAHDLLLQRMVGGTAPRQPPRAPMAFDPETNTTTVSLHGQTFTVDGFSPSGDPLVRRNGIMIPLSEAVQSAQADQAAMAMLDAAVNGRGPLDG